MEYSWCLNIGADFKWVPEINCKMKILLIDLSSRPEASRSQSQYLLFQNRQTDHNSLVFAAAPPSWTKPTKTGSHLDTLVLIGWAFHGLDTGVTLLLTAGADHKVLSPIRGNKIQENYRVNPSINSLNRLSRCLWERRNNQAAPYQQYFSSTLFFAAMFIARWITIIVTQKVVT